MSEVRARPRSEKDAIAVRDTVLGQMHGGTLRMEPSRPFLRRIVRMSVAANVFFLFALWLSFRIKNFFPPHDAPLMSAIGWYFFFGSIYGGIGYWLYTLALQQEYSAVTRAVTPNRRYEWHSRYDTENIRTEDLKKVANAPSAPEIKPPVRVGEKIYFYARFFAVCALISSIFGLHAFLHSLP